MDALRTLLEQQPLLALVLTVAIGYMAGELHVKGFSLGVGAVLFVALGVGWFAPNAAPPALLGTFGLALFLYAIGLQCGPAFFAGLTSAAGLKANLAAVAGVLCSGAATLAVAAFLKVPVDHAIGLFAGSGTSTPALQAAIATLGRDDPAVGYSVSYPFGVAGPILILFLAFSFLKPRFKALGSAGMELLEIALRRPEHVGRRLAELTAALPPDVRIVALRRGERNQAASPESVLEEEDVLLAVAPARASLDLARRILGEAASGRLIPDRQDLDYLRVFASRADVAGRRLGDLALPGGRASTVLHVRRGDADLLPEPDLAIESGDRVGLLARRDDFPALRRFFGDSIKGTAEFSYISIGLGMAVGLVIGAVRIPLPGIGPVALGLAGVLIAALVLGKRRRAAGLSWVLPTSANLVLRNLGLTLFLVQIGMASGPKFAATVTTTGVLTLGLGVLVLLALVLPILLTALLVFRMPFDQAAGVVAGACGNPAILAYASKLAPTDGPDVGYAMIFPGMTLLKILFVSVVPAILQ